MILFELFDSQFPLSDIKHDGICDTIVFNDSSGSEVEVSLGIFDPEEKKIYGASFTRNGSAEKTGAGEEFKVFSTVIRALDNLTLAIKPHVIFFGADLTHGNRASLYKRMVGKFARDRGFSINNITQVDPLLQRIGKLFDGEEVFFLISKNYVPPASDT